MARWMSAALVLSMSLSVLAGAMREPPTDGATISAPAVKPIRLTVDYHDGVLKTFTAIEHRKGLSAFEALQAAGKHPRGVKLETKGSGETAFVVSIDGLKNEGGGAQAKNWQFKVNGKLAKRGAGVTELAAGDEVVWVFDVFLQ